MQTRIEKGGVCVRVLLLSVVNGGGNEFSVDHSRVTQNQAAGVVIGELRRIATAGLVASRTKLKGKVDHAIRVGRRHRRRLPMVVPTNEMDDTEGALFEVRDLGITLGIDGQPNRI